ncbi:MAG: hypothetical protein HY702_00960 [Gemmatimonadetes bacterium]|nr:hypothetical protein [Gemmatimonadota bacterium]
MRVSIGRYAMVALVVGAGAWVVGLLVPPDGRASLWTGAGAALSVQAPCVGGLWLGARSGGQGFLAAWAAGILTRVVALVAFGVWGVPALGLVAAPALLAMAGTLFLLVLVEPVALRRPEMARA